MTIIDTSAKKRRVCAICGNRRLCVTMPIDGIPKFVCSEDEAIAREFRDRQERDGIADGSV